MSGTSGTDHDFSDAQDDQISAALVQGATYREAAEAAGVSKSAVGRRMEDPIFRSAIQHERMRALHRAGHRLGELTETALDVYANVMEDPKASTTQRLKAAGGVLSAFRAMTTDLALANRLSAIQEQLDAAEAG